MSSVWFSGTLTSKGLYFCCGSPDDNILQIAITDQIVKHFPPFEPGFYGKYIQNYHYWDSLVMGELIRVFKLPLIATDYQYMTIFISLFLGLSSIVFSQLLKIGKAFTRWLVFFLYLGGDFVWLLITIFRKQNFFGMNPLESGQQFLENIPRGISVVVFFGFAAIFLLWIKKKDKYLGLIMAIMAASLIGFKIYIGIFVLSGLGVLGIWSLFKRQYSMTIPLILTAVLSLIIYLPVNSGAGGLYFTGLWRFENFIVQPYLGNLNRLELARVIYVVHHSWLRVTEYELIFAFVYIFSIFGTKLLGIFQNKKSLSLFPKELNILLFVGIAVSAVAGLFFEQTTGGSNTFNFLVSIYILGSIYTALACFYWLNKRRNVIKIFVTLVIIIFTIPRALDQTYNNVNNLYYNKGFLITNNELRAINFLSTQENQKMVLVDPQIPIDYLSPYLSFLSNQKMFLSGQGEELTTHGVNFSDRSKARITIFYGANPASASAALLKYNIGYIYMLPTNNLISTNSAQFLKQIYKNKSIKILKVDEQLASEFSKKYKNSYQNFNYYIQN